MQPLPVLGTYIFFAEDFNGDGFPDLILCSGDTEGYPCSLSAGNGDGTFQAPVPVATLDVPVGAADLNGDGKLDLILNEAGNDRGLCTALGNGNGTFQNAVCLSAVFCATNAIVGNFNGDGIGPCNRQWGNNGCGEFQRVRPHQLNETLGRRLGFLARRPSPDGIAAPYYGLTPVPWMVVYLLAPRLIG